MDENDKKVLPNYEEIHSGDTLYKISSVFAEKGDFRTLLEELIISRATCGCDCKTA